MKKAFVTGGTGFLGLNLVEQLREAGVEVVALHRRTSDVARLRAFGVQLAEGAITSASDVLAAMPEGCDAVFHVAGNTSQWSGHRAVQTRENVEGTRNVVQAALARGAACLVHTSSVSAYGRQEPPGFDETASSTALASRSTYERTKYLGELEVLEGASRGLRAVILEPASILGRYDTRSWARLITLVDAQKLPGVPGGRGTFCGATEVARAHVAAVTKGRPGERYLLGGDQVSMLELIQTIGRHLGKPTPRRATPRPVLWAVAWAGELASHLTGREPTLTPEMLVLGSRPPAPPSSEKAKRELGYATRPLDALVFEACAWLRAEGLVGR
jgi:nucleoside-diphosphate-sugar epimerase